MDSKTVRRLQKTVKTTPLHKIFRPAFINAPSTGRTLHHIKIFFFFTREPHHHYPELKKRESKRGSSLLSAIFFRSKGGGADLLRMRKGRSFQWFVMFLFIALHGTIQDTYGSYYHPNEVFSQLQQLLKINK